MPEFVHCVETKRLVAVLDAFIVTRGDDAPLYIIGGSALQFVTPAARRYKQRCKPGEKGLEFFSLSFEHQMPQKGTFLFSVGENHPIFLPTVEAGLLHH